jgi:hypothetical protein
MPTPFPHPQRTLLAVTAASVVTGMLTVSAVGRPSVTPSTVQHVVFIFQENHSFDNVLGAWCVQAARCDAAITGKTKGGGTVALAKARDQVPNVAHYGAAQVVAIDGGTMDGFSAIAGRMHSPATVSSSPARFPTCWE